MPACMPRGLWDESLGVICPRELRLRRKRSVRLQVGPSVTLASLRWGFRGRGHSLSLLFLQPPLSPSGPGPGRTSHAPSCFLPTPPKQCPANRPWPGPALQSCSRGIPGLRGVPGFCTGVPTAAPACALSAYPLQPGRSKGCLPWSPLGHFPSLLTCPGLSPGWVGGQDAEEVTTPGTEDSYAWSLALLLAPPLSRSPWQGPHSLVFCFQLNCL